MKSYLIPIQLSTLLALDHPYPTDDTELYGRALTYIFSILETKMDEHKYAYIEDLFSQYEIGEYSVIVSTGILRCTYRCRKKIANWYPLRDLIKLNLDQRYEDTATKMRGLFDD